MNTNMQWLIIGGFSRSNSSLFVGQGRVLIETNCFIYYLNVLFISEISEKYFMNFKLDPNLTLCYRIAKNDLSSDLKFINIIVRY